MRAQIQGRINAEVFDGIEIFVMEDAIANPAKYKELLNFARDNFPSVNLETFHEINIGNKPRSFGIIDSRQSVREKSRQLLETTISLNKGMGNITTHFVGTSLDVEVSRSWIHSPEEQVAMLGEYLQQFNQVVSVENIISFESETSEKRRFAFNVGCTVKDFTTLWNTYKIPMTLDTAHSAISLAQFSRIAAKGYLYSDNKTRKNRIPFPEEQIELGREVNKSGLTDTWMDQVKQLPSGSIKNIHFINGRLDEKDNYTDGYAELSPEQGRLLDLNKVLNYLSQGDDAGHIVTEVAENLYSSNPDFEAVPHMARMARALKEKSI